MSWLDSWVYRLEAWSKRNRIDERWQAWLDSGLGWVFRIGLPYGIAIGLCILVLLLFLLA